MATRNQIPTDLTIALEDDLSPSEFVAAIRDFMGYVAEITETQKDNGDEITWTVRVHEGSALIGVEPNSSAPKSKLAMIYSKAKHGATALAEGDVEGAKLSEKAVNHLKHLSDLAGKRQNGKGFNLWIQKEPISISAGIAKTIQEDWRSDYYDFGTIEGRLEAIIDTSGALRIRVKDILYQRAINCDVPEKLIDKVLRNFRRRVEIEGSIHYRRNGTPISIGVDAIEELPEDDDLPTADDVRGIMVNT